MNKHTAGILITLAGGIFWGFSGSCGQRLFQNNALTPQTLASIRMLFSGILILCVCSVRRTSRGLFLEPLKRPRSILSLLLFGLVGIGFCQLTYFETIRRSNAGTATVIQYLSPVLLVAGTAIVKRTFPDLKKITAVLLSVIGIWILATHGKLTALSLSPDVLFWGLLSAVAYALSSVLPEKLFKEYGVLTTMGWGMTLGSLPMLLIFQPWNHLQNFHSGDIPYLIMIIIFGTVMAYVFYMSGVSILGAEMANICACIEPAAATFFSVVWLGTKIVLTDYIGMALIVSAIIVLSIHRHHKKAVIS